MKDGDLSVYAWGFIKQYKLLSLLDFEETLDKSYFNTFKRMDKEWKDYINKLDIRSLDNLPIKYSPNSKIKKEEDIISYSSTDKKKETCLLGEPMTEGIYQITFKLLKSDDLRICLIDTSLGMPSEGKGVCEENKGVEFRIEKEAADRYGYVYNKNNHCAYSKIYIYDDVICCLQVDLSSKVSSERVLSIFEKDERERYCLKNLPESVQFGITMNGRNCSIAFLSLESLTKPTKKKTEFESSWDGK